MASEGSAAAIRSGMTRRRKAIRTGLRYHRCGRIRPMKRSLVLLLLSVNLYGQTRRGASFTVVEATIPEMQTAMKKGRVTSRELVRQYLVRIGLYEDKLHAVITVNRDALKEAEARDRERKQGKLRGRLHGIPVALK